MSCGEPYNQFDKRPNLDYVIGTDILRVREPVESPYLCDQIRKLRKAVKKLSHKLDRVLVGQHNAAHQQEQIMSTLADVQAKVTAEDTVIDSAIALLQGLAAQVAALTPDQAAIDALAADIGSKTDALAAAVAANTPAAPAP